MDEKTIKVCFNDKVFEVLRGTSVSEFLVSHNIKCERPPLGVIITNRIKSLNTHLTSSCTLTLLTLEHREAESIYKRTVSILLYAAIKELYPEVNFVVGQSIGDGYFIDMFNFEESPEVIERIKNKMQEYVSLSKPIITKIVSVDEAIELFKTNKDYNKVNILRAWTDEFVPIVQFESFIDIQYGPYPPNVGVVDKFDLVKYEYGMVLRFFLGPAANQPPNTSVLLPKLFNTYKETREWNDLLGISYVWELNQKIVSGEIRELINVAEGFHEKKIALIADEIVAHKDKTKIIIIAGPSSSGKTTFSKRLSIQLMVNGIKPIPLSLDNWYVDRDKTPKDESGNYDFESIDALNLELFNENLRDLLNGKKTYIPKFDFITGKTLPKERWQEISLEKNQILLIEGIHGLNEQLTSTINSENKYKIYVSALTQLCIDNHNRIFTSDVRLLRRIVRDRKYRGYSAAKTIELWSSVRRGEWKQIFPYQEEANVMFNSAIVYETSILKIFAERYLLEVPPDHPSFVEAQRLLKFLDMFIPLFTDYVPQTSILREFIGGSSFQYK